MSVFRSVSPALDGAAEDLGASKVRRLHIPSGEYATPFWMRLDGSDDKLIHVTSLPWRGTVRAGQIEMLSSKPATSSPTVSPISTGDPVPGPGATIHYDMRAGGTESLQVDSIQTLADAQAQLPNSVLRGQPLDDKYQPYITSDFLHAGIKAFGFPIHHDADNPDGCLGNGLPPSGSQQNMQIYPRAQRTGGGPVGGAGEVVYLQFKRYFGRTASDTSAKALGQVDHFRVHHSGQGDDGGPGGRKWVVWKRPDGSLRLDILKQDYDGDFSVPLANSLNLLGMRRDIADDKSQPAKISLGQGDEGEELEVFWPDAHFPQHSGVAGGPFTFTYRLKLESSEGAGDGELTAWVNGEVVEQQTGLFPGAVGLNTEIELGFPTWICPPQDQTEYFWDVVCWTGDHTIGEVEKWGRHEVQIVDSGYGTDNPHEIAFEATFTHVASGTQITMPGYYDGSDTFKIDFMPTRTGQWMYETASPGTLPTYTGQPSFAALDGVKGTVEVREGTNAGMLDLESPASVAAGKWKLRDGDYVIPMGLRTKAFMQPVTQAEFDAAADVLAANNVHVMETRMLDENTCYEGGRADYIFSGSFSNHQFDLTVWQRWRDRMDALRDRGLGAHIMPYSDAPSQPGWAGQSDTELLFLRYMVARTAAYPIVMYNTGIDIAEYRTEADVDWWGQQLAAFDPYDHPRSSRMAGGSGIIKMDDENFESWGGPNTASLTDDALDNDMVDRWLATGSLAVGGMPISFDDSYGEDRDGTTYPGPSGKNHSPEDIRRAAWKCVILGGAGFQIRGAGEGDVCADGFYALDDNAGTPWLESDWQSEQWLSLVNPFVRDHLMPEWPDMEWAPTLAGGTEVHACADPSRGKILYLAVGANDTYDPGGGDLTLQLSGETGTWDATWHNPRDGTTSTPAGSPFGGGSDHVVAPPSNDDWLLLLVKQ